jgi:transglutaminase-like putative cysteine protease
MGSGERFFQISLLGLLTCGYLAVVGSGVLDVPTVLLVALGLIVRTLTVAGLINPRITDRQVTAATVVYILFYPTDYFFLTRELIGATVHLVFFVAVVKLLTAHTERDYFYLKVIAFLELLAAALLSANLTFFVFLAGFLLFGVAAFASGEIRRGAHKPGVVVRGQPALSGRLSALTAFTALGILVLTGCLFFVLPRTARAAFRRLAPTQQHLTGFSNQVTLGQLGELKQESTTVMHVRFLFKESSHEYRLKWRGATLATFDGRRWSVSPGRDQVVPLEGRQLNFPQDFDHGKFAKYVSYEVQLNPVGTDYLFLTGTPTTLQLPTATVLRTSAGSVRLGYNANDPFRYSAWSYLGEPAPGLLRELNVRLPAPLSRETRALYLSLPPLDTRIPRLAQDIMSRAVGEYNQALTLERYLKTNYGYSMQMLTAPVDDPLANFLFKRRKGHCEYFASAMAVLLRTQGIPSRVVTGFQSGIYNPISKRHLIRASDAHSWVEAWFPDQGWITFDPTPPDPNADRYALLSRLTLYLDAAETFWQDWVLNYDIDRQFTLVSNFEESRRHMNGNWLRNWQDSAGEWADGAWQQIKYSGPVVVAWVAGLAAFFLIAPYAWKWLGARVQWRRMKQGKANAGDATLLYLRMLELLRRRGFEKPAWITPGEFVLQLPPELPSPLVADLTRAYQDVRFGGHQEQATRMVSLMEELERALIPR